MIKEGMLVIIVFTGEGMAWDPLSGGTSYHLGITEKKKDLGNGEKWFIKTSPKTSYVVAEEQLVPLLDVPLEDRHLEPEILIQKYQERIIVRLTAMCSHDL